MRGKSRGWRGGYGWHGNPFGGCGPTTARMWMWENPTDDEIIEMLEEYQRDLEQEAANVAERIRRIKEKQDA